MADIIIAGYHGFANSGDEALLLAILNTLRKKRPELDVTVLSKKPEETARVYGVKSIFRYNIFKVIKEMKRSKMLLFGGGSLLQDVTSSKSILYYLVIIWLAQVCGAKTSVCKIKFTFFAEDGTHVEAITIGEGMDSGDKASNKAMAVAFKYACFQVFCIPTEEMTDPDAEVHEVEAESPKQPQTEEQKNQEMMEDVGQLIISAVKVKALTKRCNDDNVPIDFILNAYGISKLEEMTEKQYRNCNDKWEVVKGKANK